MFDQSETEKIREAKTEYDLAKFLESHPPNQLARISNLAKSKYRDDYGTIVNDFLALQIQPHCPSKYKIYVLTST